MHWSTVVARGYVSNHLEGPMNGSAAHLRSVAIAVVLATPSHALAAIEDAPLPPRAAEWWPWIVVFLVVAGSASVFVHWLKKGEEKRRIDSFEAWSKTEREIAPRSHTGARLPSRDTRPSNSRPAHGESAPKGVAFGRRAS